MRIARRLLIPAILAIALSAVFVPVAAARSSAPPGWSQFGFTASHTGFNPQEATLSTANVAGLRVRWAKSLGAGNEFLGSPVAAAGRLFVQAWNGRLFALQASTGRVIWSRSVGTYAGGFAPALWGTSVIATAQNDGTGDAIAAYDRASGALRWKTSLAGTSTGATPVVAGNTVYLSTGMNIYAVSASSGQIRWKTSISGDPDLSAIDGPVAVTSDGSQVLAAALDGRVYDLAAASGKIRWQLQAGGGIHRGGPAIDRGVAYVPEGRSGAEGGGVDIVAIRLADASIVWRAFAGDDVHTTPAVAYDTVYIGAIDTGIRALNARTGALRWALESTPEIWSQPIAANGVVYQATESTLYAFDARTGRQLFWTEFGQGFANMASPAVWAGRVYMPSGEDVIRAFDLP